MCSERCPARPPLPAAVAGRPVAPGGAMAARSAVAGGGLGASAAAPRRPRRPRRDCRGTGARAEPRRAAAFAVLARRWPPGGRGANRVSPRGRCGSAARCWLGEAEVAVRGTWGRRVVRGRKRDSVTCEQAGAFLSHPGTACLRLVPQPTGPGTPSPPGPATAGPPRGSAAFPSHRTPSVQSRRECLHGGSVLGRQALPLMLFAPGRGATKGRTGACLFVCFHWKESFPLF